MTTATSHFFIISPTSAARARLEEVEQYFLAGNLNEALAAAQQGWREYPNDPDIFRVLAYLHMARGELPPAVQAAQRAIALDGDNVVSYATLIQVYLTFDMRTRADEIVTLARERFPDNAALLTLMADLRFRQGREKEGRTLAEEALLRNPHDGYVKALLGEHHLRCRRYAEAARLLAEAVTVYAQREDYLRDLGIALLHRHAVPEACAALARSYRIAPHNERTKQYLYIALRARCGMTAFETTLMRFFYEQAGLGWTLHLLGYLAGLTGLLWGIKRLADISAAGWSATALLRTESVVPFAILIGGVMLVVLTLSGVIASTRHGRKLDAWLEHKLEDTPAS